MFRVKLTVVLIFFAMLIVTTEANISSAFRRNKTREMMDLFGFAEQKFRSQNMSRDAQVLFWKQPSLRSTCLCLEWLRTRAFVTGTHFCLRLVLSRERMLSVEMLTGAPEEANNTFSSSFAKKQNKNKNLCLVKHPVAHCAGRFLYIPF